MQTLFPGEDGLRETIRFIEEKVGFGFWSWDFSTDRMEWSGGMFHHLGVGRESFSPTRNSLRALVHPDDQAIFSGLERILRSGDPAARELRILRPNGRLRWINILAESILDAAGHPVRAVGLVVDRTVHHEAEKASRLLEERYRAVLETLPAIVWFCDAEGHVSEVRGQSGAILAESLLDLGWQALAHPDDRSRALAAWKAAAANHGPYDIEYRLRGMDGSYRWCRSKAVPVGASGKNEYAGSTCDIQDQKVIPTHRDPTRLTGAQLRAARAILHWPVKTLAERSGVSSAVIRRLESLDGLAPASEGILRALMASLADSGVDFLFPEMGKPGVSPH